MIEFTNKGSFKHTLDFLNRLKNVNYDSVLAKYGEMGVKALREATPVRTGKTANSWTYEIEQEGSVISIVWSNTNVNNHVNIAAIIQTGHGTGTGGYVKGIDYINPAMKPIFEKIADEAWKEVNNL